MCAVVVCGNDLEKHKNQVKRTGRNLRDLLVQPLLVQAGEPMTISDMNLLSLRSSPDKKHAPMSKFYFPVRLYEHNLASVKVHLLPPPPLTFTVQETREGLLIHSADSTVSSLSIV
uniref:Uncharacterized protein n=1 Tax=Micrurus surinamensis TaxID=129470 RepID=A0A2D4P3X4_MICSU